jgi:hypothetical protein
MSRYFYISKEYYGSEGVLVLFYVIYSAVLTCVHSAQLRASNCNATGVHGGATERPVDICMDLVRHVRARTIV